MGGSGRVEFGGFVILWPKPNLTHYKKKKKFVTQPNPPNLKNWPNLASRVGLSRVWRVDEFSAHPYGMLMSITWRHQLIFSVGRGDL